MRLLQKQSMRNFLERECARVDYVAKREKVRAVELRQRQLQIEAAELRVRASFLISITSFERHCTCKARRQSRK